MGLAVDASNSCIPPSCSLSAQTPPLPKTERGVPLCLEGFGGRLNSDRPLIVYPSGRLVIVRELSLSKSKSKSKPDNDNKKLKSFVYRGHTAQVTCAKFSPSGCYIASADVRGKLRVWSYDNEEHLCKLDMTSALTGPIRDLSWDFESKRIVIVGEGSKSSMGSLCAKVVQWDTGVKIGDLGQHSRNKASSCAFKPNRPMRVVTGGADDFKCIFNKGPPFARVPVTQGTPAESSHLRGSIHCVRYNRQGTIIASVGTDKSVIFYHGTTMQLLHKMENVHLASIYSCAWTDDGMHLLTCSADGTVKSIAIDSYHVTTTWNVAQKLFSNVDSNADSNGDATFQKVPMGGMLMGCTFVHGNVPTAITMNGKIAILSTTDESDIQFLSGHTSPISSMTIDHQTSTMYTADSDGMICKWDTATGTAITNIQRDISTEEGFDETLMNKVHSGAITGMTWANGSLFSIGWDDTVRTTTDETTTNCTKLDAQPNAISKGKDLVVIMTVNGLLLMKDGKITSDLIHIPYEPSCVCISADDSTVYVGGRDCNVHIYNVNDNTLDEIQQLAGTHMQPIYSLAISNDGTKLATADTRDICVWNVTDGYETIIGKSRWCFHNQRINALAWANDDSVLASGANDDSIYFWSLQKKTTRVHYPHAHRGGVSAMEFLKHIDGMVLVSVGNDGCVNQWDITNDVTKKFGLGK